MLIRERRDDDRVALEHLGAAVYRSDGYPRYLPASFGDFLVSDDALGAWVATVDTAAAATVDTAAADTVDRVTADRVAADIVGHVALHPRSAPEVMAAACSATGLAEHELAVVARLLVAPDVRRAGTGRALLDVAVDAAVARGRRAVLDVVIDHHSAIRLYEDAGWVQADTVTWTLPDGSPLTEFVYVSPSQAPSGPPA